MEIASAYRFPRRGFVLCITVVLLCCLVPTASGGPPGVAVNPGEGTLGTVLDFHEVSGNLFVVVFMYEDLAEGYSVYMSDDGGATWARTGGLTGVDDMLGVDAVVVGEELYVVYVVKEASGEKTVIASRFSAFTGALDPIYSPTQVVQIDQDSFVQIALVSNADDADNRLHLLVADDSDLRWFYSPHDSPGGSGAWTEIATGIHDFINYLDATWNDDFTTYKVFASYVNDTGNLAIVRWFPGAFDTRVLDAQTYWPTGTSISAYADTVVCTFGRGDDEYALRYRISRNEGDNWTWGEVHPGNSWANFDSASVTLRGGDGIAIGYARDSGVDLGRYDWYRHRGYASTDPWGDPVVTHQAKHSYSGRPRVTVQHLPSAHPFSFGAVTVAQSPSRAYFYLPESFLFRDGFETLNTSAWAETVP